MIFRSQMRGDQALVLHFKQMSQRLRDELRDAIFDDLVKLQDYIVQKELAGQVLKRRTGALGRSVKPEPVIESENGIVGKIGPNVPYGRILEYGGTIKHPGGTAYIIGDDGLAEFISNAVAAGLPELPRTKPHDIPIPAHPYMRPALVALKDTIKRDLRAAAVRAMKP